ncbi:MAG: CNNM domain-containing protein [Halobacteriales archaeon]
MTLLVAQRFSGGTAAVVATTAASVLILVLGEIIPKSYGLGNAERWALRAARPMAVVSVVLYPVVAVFDVVTSRVSGSIGGDTGVERTYEEY